MNKKAAVLCLIILSFVVIGNATVWRLNNIPGVDADFTTTLQDAVDGVAAGDTIYVEQSPFSYGGATIDKQVILIGGGYWHTENDSTSANTERSIIDDVSFNVGSEGSILIGISIDKIINDNVWDFVLINVNTDDIILERCFIQISVVGGDPVPKLILLNGDVNNIIIQQNWIYFYNNNESGNCIYLNGDTQNVLIRNNFIRSVTNNSTGGYPIYMETASSLNSPQINGNIIIGNMSTYDCLYLNNIQISGNFYNGAGGVTANNICNATQFPDSNNNQQNVDMSTVFVDHDLYIDNGYILAPGSPAIGAGFNGGDCGMFSNDYGGNTYRLSGLPAIPAIYEIDFNSTIFPSDENTLEGNLKAKSHN